MKELKEKIDEKQLLLTMTLESYKGSVSEAFDYPSTAKYFNFMHFKLKELYQSDYELELKSHNIHDLEYAIDILINLGVPSTKILIAIKLGGFEMVSFDDLKLHNLLIAEGYDYICFRIIFNNFNITYNSEFGMGVAMGLKKKFIYLIESSRVIANKIRFAMRKKLGGALIEGIGYDDYNHRCNELDNDTYADYNSVIPGVILNIPIRTNRSPFFANIVNEAIVVALDEIEQENKIMTMDLLRNLLEQCKNNNKMN